MIHDEIKEDLKEAMKNKDDTKKEVLRGVLTAFTNELISAGKKPDEKLPDEEANTVLARLSKQRKDSIKQYEAGGRDDLVQGEAKELEVLQAYLPEQMSEEEVEKAVLAKKEKLGVTDTSEKGKLMGAIMQDLKGKADGTVVKSIVDASFEASS